MKIALDWIAKYLDQPVDAGSAQEALINAGLVVENVHKVGNTHILDVEVTSNRTDCLSHIGLARELAALLRRQFTMPIIPRLPSEKEKADQFAAVQITAPDLCPYYSARVLRNVKIGPSPAWLKNSLESIGLRSINNVVDVTNYVLMETGQPLHAFDSDKLQGEKIIVRRAAGGETLITIDGHIQELAPDMLVIADAAVPVALAGVMGSKASEVSQNTRNILLESARFEPLSIRNTSRRLGLSSDSSMRFERGIDPAMAEYASLRAAELILQTAGGELAADVLRAGSVKTGIAEISVRISRIEKILGVKVPDDVALDILQRLELSPRLSGEKILCHIPSFRGDITREIDLIEEISRVWGYQNIPLLDHVSHAVTAPSDADLALRTARQTLAECGWHEAITYSFVDQDEARMFLPADRAPVKVSDAVRKAVNVLRPSVWPGLLRARQLNQNNGTPDARLFEQACAYSQHSKEENRPPFEERQLALVGHTFSQVIGAVEILLARLNPQALVQAQPLDDPCLARGASAKLFAKIINVNKSAANLIPIGRAGHFSSTIRQFYDLRHDVAGVELQWNRLLELYCPVRQAQPLPRFQAVRRDLSVVIGQDQQWADVREAILAAQPEFLQNVEFVGTYCGKGIAPDKKSLTLTLVFRKNDATLRSEEVDQQIQQVLTLLGSRFSAVLRA
ncbi:MAG TPA: phenylalanine--tRNA ligase subunit beta [Phycisphaerae bacterium]|nr:phenylalanine--tRNA ligase subunit beta [Phycisphaerae bacterium]